MASAICFGFTVLAVTAGSSDFTWRPPRGNAATRETGGTMPPLCRPVNAETLTISRDHKTLAYCIDFTIVDAKPYRAYFAFVM